MFCLDDCIITRINQHAPRSARRQLAMLPKWLCDVCLIVSNTYGHNTKPGVFANSHYYVVASTTASVSQLLVVVS